MMAAFGALLVACSFLTIFAMITAKYDVKGYTIVGFISMWLILVSCILYVEVHTTLRYKYNCAAYSLRCGYTPIRSDPGFRISFTYELMEIGRQ